MKTGHQLLLSIAIVGLFVVFLNVKPQLTGMAVSQPEALISIDKVQIYDTSGKISWSTEKTATSEFSVQGKSASFDYARSFEMQLEGLVPGTQYNYQIRACDRSQNCRVAAGTFVTLNSPASRPTPITGNVAKAADGLQKTAGTGLLVLIIAAISMVLVNAGVQRLDKNELMPPSVRINFMLQKAEEALKEKNHHQAFEQYSQIRRMYPRLGQSNKFKTHRRVINVYHELNSHNNAKEATHLSDKYLQGTITKQELARLSELIEN